ncbi:MAG: DUF1885 family protein [Bacilli bacterium]
MIENTKIYLVGQPNEDYSLEQVEQLLTYYKEIGSKLGEQLDFPYAETAFPYTIEKKEQHPNVLFLRARLDRYQLLLIGVNSEVRGENNIPYIQITADECSETGDRNKAIELAKFIAKHVAGELHLPNERVMYFYKR